MKHTALTLAVSAALTLSGWGQGTNRMVIIGGSESGVAGSQDGNGTSAGFKGPTGVATDDKGNVFVADNGNLTVRKITLDKQVTTLAGTVGVSGVVDATGMQAQFVDPLRIAVDKNGNCYVSDNASLIRKVSPLGAVTTLAGSLGVGLKDDVGSRAQFANPYGLALASSGVLYVADTGNFAIRSVTTSSPVSTVTTIPSARLSTPVLTLPLPPLMASFTQAYGVFITLATPFVDPGSVNTYQWLKNGVAIPGATAATYAVAATYSAGGASGATYSVTTNGLAAGSAAITFVTEGGPRGICVNSTGKLVVAEYGRNIISVSTDTFPIIRAGSIQVPGYADGIEANARFRGPSDVAIDAEDNVYVADTQNNAIRKLTPYGKVSTLIAPIPPTNLINFGDSAMHVANLSLPTGLAVDTAGNLIIADTGNNRIWRFTLTPTAPTVATATEITNTAFTANWQTVPGAAKWAHPDAKFIVQVATDPEFSNLVRATEVACDVLAANFSGLAAGKTHYVRVAVRNEGGTGLFSSTGVVNPMQEPTAQAPTNIVSSGSGSSAALGFSANWTAVTGVSGYELDLSTSATFSTKVTGYDAKPVTGNTLAIANLQPGVYCYRLRSVFPVTGSTTAKLVGGNSNVITLQVLPPVEATAATEITLRGFNANWQSVLGATSYTLDVATDANFTNLVTGFSGVDTGPATNLPVTGLDAGTQYYYRVKAACAIQGITTAPSAYSNVITVNTLAPDTVQALPAMGIVSNANTVEFVANWSAVNTATGYALDVATDAAFTSPVVGFTAKSVGNVTSFTVSNLREATTYYYRLRAQFNSSNGQNSNVISVAIPAIALSSPEATPAINLSSTAASIEFTATWTSVAGATSYVIDVARDVNFTQLLPNYAAKNVGNVTNLRVLNLGEKDDYFYRVKAVSATNTGGYSNTVNVRTLGMSTPETIKQAVKGGGAPSLPFILILGALAAIRLARKRD